MKTGQLIDRFRFAAGLSKNRRVLDIGGQKPRNEPTNPFGIAHREISDSASQYEVLDRDLKGGVKYVADLNSHEGREMLTTVLHEYRPEVVLCMEVLEHLNYPCEVMDILGEYVLSSKAVLFVTLPNNGSWVLNALNWHSDHNFAFFKSLAARFVKRSELGNCDIEMYPCMQTYRWFWWIVYLLAFCQPFNWGFKITAPKGLTSAPSMKNP